jgi:nucleoid-associated protein YgaU
MPVGKKLVVAVSVMAAGAGAALFFRKDASQVTQWHEALEQSPFRQRVERRVAADAARAKTALSAGRQASPDATAAFRVPTAETAAISQLPAADTQPTFHKSFHPVGALLEPIENPSDEPRDVRDLTDDGGAAPLRLTHKITDGDTLSKLAERYLGRGERYLEIYDLNRDVLANPDLLPIGVLLKIPPRGGPPPAGGSQGASGGEQTLAPPTELVPVEPDSRGQQG